MNELKNKLIQEFSFSDEQVQAVLKLNPLTVKRALDMTHLYHPGDRTKFKEYLNFFNL